MKTDEHDIKSTLLLQGSEPEKKPVTFHEFGNLEEMKIKIEEQGIISHTLRQVADFFYYEEKPLVFNECNKVKDETCYILKSQNNIFMRQVLPSKLTENIEQSQLAVGNLQYMDLDCEEGLNETKVEEFEENFQPMEASKGMLFMEEKTLMLCEGYVTLNIVLVMLYPTIIHYFGLKKYYKCPRELEAI